MKTYITKKCGYKIITLLLSFASCSAKGQQNKPALYLHLDKSVYTGNEIIWFTGYAMNITNAKEFSTLFVTLNDPEKKKVLLSSRFVMEEGLCQGVLQIPDSFPAGEYALVAYTDHLFTHPDDAVFQQWISVRYSNSPSMPFLKHLKDTSAKLSSSTVKATITIDSASYHKRSRVRMKIQIRDTSGKPVHGLFSVACVRNTRIRGRVEDIMDYADANFILPHLIKDTIPPFFIQVGFGNKRKLKSPACVMINHDSGFSIVKTDKDGSLSINPYFLAASYGNTVTLTVVEKKNQDLYRLAVEENDLFLNGALARRNFPFLLASPNKEEVFTDEEKNFIGQRLATVVVKGKRLPDFMHPEYNQLPIMDGPCAAWVCSCNHWKCGGCPPFHSPVKGFSYLDQNSGRIIRYNGCPDDTIVKPFIKRIKGINYPRPFQGPDFSQDYADGPFYNTTLYWNYLVITDDHGDASLEFYTNDLGGHFTCIVEGLSTIGLVSGRHDLVVTDQPDLAQNQRQPDQ